MDSGKYSGLTDAEILESRTLNGANENQKKVKSEWLDTILDIVTEPMFIILVFSSMIYFILGEVNEGIIMILAILFVSGISIFQEGRSKNALKSLKKLSDPHTIAIRNGVENTILVEELVVGDIIYITDGNIIPADAEVLKSNDFLVNESMLTGESLALHKTQEADQNSIFKGATVVSGSCTAKVVAVGDQTKIGGIGASMQAIKNTKTPLQMQIASFTKSMVIVGLGAFLLVWGMNYYEEGDILKSLLKGLTLAMSILPEEIPVAFSTFMALGAYHLYKKNVIAKSPYTVETLGAATVICTDKTGTITQNKMEIASIYDFQSDTIIKNLKEDAHANIVIEYAMWSSEVEPFDSMEISIHQKYGEIIKEDKRPLFKMAHEYPLSGKPPIMTHVFKNKGTDEVVIAVKGSVEGVLRQSKLDKDQKTKINKIALDLANDGYRVLGVGRASMDYDLLPDGQDEFSFEFLGLISFYDPPKSNTIDTIKAFYKAGIEVKMITGDHVNTAASIAGQVGIRHADIVLTGEEIMKMSLDELKKAVAKTNVFARMFPDAKLKIIEALQANGEVVAMTGDGVNDGPALKAAHIGIAMGKSGSEVAKDASALILLDDDLSWMVDAVALGRKIYENLKKAIRYIISIHIPIILIVALPLILFWKYTDIFSPIHVIFLELIMGPTCSIIFENEPIEPKSMTTPPRKLTANFFSMKELTLSIIQGLVITIACLGLGYYFMENGESLAYVRTSIYATLIFSNVFLTLANRSFYYSIFKTLRYKNNLIPIIIILSIIVLLTSIYFTPLQTVFMFVTIDTNTLLLSLLLAFVGVMWVEVYKYIVRSRSKKGNVNS